MEISKSSDAANAGLDMHSMYEAFIGPEKSAYYVPLFERFDAGGRSASWNWPAALVPQLWMLSRSMFLWGFIYYPICSIAFSLLLAALVPAGISKEAHLFLSLVSLLLVVGITGTYGNKIFHLHTKKLIEKSGRLGFSDQQRRDWLIRKGATNVAWVVIVIFVAIAMIGILAAIAIPAYQDYIQRSRVMESMMQVDKVKTVYSDFFTSHKQLPASTRELGLDEGADYGPNLSTIVVGDEHELDITFKGSLIGGKSVVFIPVVSNNSLTWVCRTKTLPKKYAPSNCRG